MKKFRILAFLCVIVMAFSMVSFASAAEKPVMHVGSTSANRMGYEGNYYLLKNKETVKFFVGPGSNGSLYPAAKSDTRWSYSDVIFDCTGPVKASCPADWVHITNVKGGFFFNYDSNNNQTNRTTTVSVKAKGYSAKFVLTQFGKSTFTSVVRNKKVVTFKWKSATKGKVNQLYVYMYRYDDDGFSISKSEYIDIPEGKKSTTYKVKAGWNYTFEIITQYQVTSERTTSSWSDSVYCTVTKDNIDKKEVLR